MVKNLILVLVGYPGFIPLAFWVDTLLHLEHISPAFEKGKFIVVYFFLSAENLGYHVETWDLAYAFFSWDFCGHLPLFILLF